MEAFKNIFYYKGSNIIKILEMSNKNKKHLAILIKLFQVFSSLQVLCITLIII